MRNQLPENRQTREAHRHDEYAAQEDSYWLKYQNHFDPPIREKLPENRPTREADCHAPCPIGG